MAFHISLKDIIQLKLAKTIFRTQHVKFAVGYFILYNLILEMFGTLRILSRHENIAGSKDLPEYFFGWLVKKTNRLLQINIIKKKCMFAIMSFLCVVFLGSYWGLIQTFYPAQWSRDFGNVDYN